MICKKCEGVGFFDDELGRIAIYQGGFATAEDVHRLCCDCLDGRRCFWVARKRLQQGRTILDPIDRLPEDLELEIEE